MMHYYGKDDTLWTLMDKLSNIIFSKKQLSPLVSEDIFACGSVFAFTPLPCFGLAIFAP